MKVLLIAAKEVFDGFFNLLLAPADAHPEAKDTADGRRHGNMPENRYYHYRYY